jgi:hypothetical protein
VTHTSSPRRALAVAGLAAAQLPLTAMPALAFTEPVSAPLSAPTGLTPDDSAAAYPHAIRKTVKLDWAPVSGASGYRVEVGRDSTWSDDPVFTQDVASSELTLPVSLPHASYVWRVAALKGTTLGHWSSEEGQAHSEAEFTRGWTDVPGQIAPTTSVFGYFPEFSWTPVDGASAYEVQVSDTNYNTPAPVQTDPTQYVAPGKVDTCFTARTRVTFFTEHVQHGEANAGPCSSTLLGDGSARWWRVRALDNFVEAAKDVTTSPGAGGISQNPPKTADKPDPTVGSDCQGDTGGTCTPTNPAEFGSWSDWTGFSVGLFTPTNVDLQTPVPTATVAQDPDNACTVVASTDPGEHAVCRDFPTVTWDPVSGAAFYRVTVALDAAMSNVQRIVDTSGLSWTPTDSWADSTPGTSYYYTVQACQPDACGFVTTTPPSFKKVTPRPTLGTKPGVTGDVTLSWNSCAAILAAASGQDESQDAFAYHVQVAKAANPSYDATVLDTKVDQTYLTLTDALSDGDYVWRVQVVDTSGHKLPWSYSQAFTRDATPPKVVSVSPSSRVATKQSLKVVFSETVTGLNSATVTAVNGATTAPTTLSVGGDGRSATLVPTKPFVPGASYVIHVASSVKDLSNNVAVAVGPGFTVNPIVDDKNAAVTFSAGWTRLASSNAYGGTFVQSATAGRYLTMPFSGPAVAVVGCLGPNSGYADISVGSVKKRVSLYRSYSGCGVKLASLTGLGSGTHTVKVVVVGAHTAKSKGNNVGIDFLTAGA